MDGASQPVVDRQASIDRFRETRERTAGMFDLLTEEAYYDQPIPLRHPVGSRLWNLSQDSRDELEYVERLTFGM